MGIQNLWVKFQNLILSYGGLTRTGKHLSVICFCMMLAGQAAAQTTILAFGDSLTQGYGLPQQDGFVPQMERWLQDHGADVRLINGGVSGDTTAGGAARIDWSLDSTIDAVILCLGGNDVLRGLPPQTSRGNLRQIIETVNRRNLPLLLIGMKAPGNYGATYKAEFDAIYPKLAAEYDLPFAPDFFAPLRQISSNPADLKAYFQADGIHPNAQGVALIVSHLGPQVLTLLDAQK